MQKRVFLNRKPPLYGAVVFVIMCALTFGVLVATIDAAVPIRQAFVKPALAAQGPAISLNPSSGPPGTQVVINGSGYAPGGYPGSIMWDQAKVGTFPIPNGGAFSQVVTVPANAAPGNHTVSVCAGDPCFTFEFEQIASATFEVTVPPPASETDFFYVEQEQVPVTLALDEIGVIAQAGVEQKQIEAFASQYGLQVSESLDNLHVLALDQALERNELVAFARTIRQAGQEEQLLKEAGIVARLPEDQTTPMVITDEFVAQFLPNVTRPQIDALNEANQVEIVRPDPFVPNQYILTVGAGSPFDALTIANQYQENDLTDFAHADFWVVREKFESLPTDPLFGNQWHHRNTGAGGGTADADADTTVAWDITQGSPDVVIAVIDEGIEYTHEDLAPNLATNTGETAGDGVDNDHNGYIDDVNGWDFIDSDNDPSPSGPDDNHGTATTGAAVARHNNGVGVSGSCPNCRFVPLRVCCVDRASAYASAFDYATSRGVDIINNSWGVDSTAWDVPTVERRAIQRATDADIMVFFSGGNRNTAGWCSRSYPSLLNVFAVSSSTNLDKKAVGGVIPGVGVAPGSAFGNCIDILAPSYHGDPGTLGAITTDRTGVSGYNRTRTICPPFPLTELTNQNYTNCFGGTSFASPLSAGIAGLVRTVNADLNRSQVQRLLQDTADKIEPGLAAYSPSTGFSTPAAGIATHSWGRINAHEAVRVAAPVAQGGKGGVDLFMRDNNLDWGNTEQPSSTLFESPRGFIAFYQSVDIKVDSPLDGYQPAPTTSDEFERLHDENPIAGRLNKVYVRVRNRGPVTAEDVTVKLHYAYAGTGLPRLPSDFWSRFPADSTDVGSHVQPVGTATLHNLAYSGASVAGTPGDNAQIAQFDFMAPMIDPEQPSPHHYCLFVVMDSPQDPIAAHSRTDFVIDTVTPRDNNITLRNVRLVGSLSGMSLWERFFIRNPYEIPIEARLRLNLTGVAQSDWHVQLTPYEFDKPFTLAAGAEVLATLYVTVPVTNTGGVIEVIQERTDTQPPEVMGGMVYTFQASNHQPDNPNPELSLNPDGGVPGNTITVSGTGYTPGNYVGSIRWDDKEIGLVVIPASGAFDETFTIPDDATVGAHTITICAGDPCLQNEYQQTASAQVMVSALNWQVFLPFVEQ